MHNRVTVPQFGRVIVYATILLIAVLPNTASNHAPQPAWPVCSPQGGTSHTSTAQQAHKSRLIQCNFNKTNDTS